MKYIIAVSISNDIHYNVMKDIWIKNMTFNGTHDMELYFIYGRNMHINKKIQRILGNIYNFYGTTEETLVNVLYKTLDFMEYIDNKYDEYILIRTNASTMFNLPLLKRYIENISISPLFASGTFTNIHLLLDGVTYYIRFISGTNLCIPKKIVQTCINEKQTLTLLTQKGFLEDVSFSMVILNQPNIITYNMTRIDMLDDKIELQYFYNIIHMLENDLENTLSLLNICCFRFKSNDRTLDIFKMYTLLDNNFNLNTLIRWINQSVLAILI